MLKFVCIEIYTGEDVHWNGKPLYLSIVEFVRSLKTAARSYVFRAIEGVYENGETATSRFEVMSLQMPLKIEIIVPEPEVDKVLPQLKIMVTDGIICMRDVNVVLHRSAKHLIPKYLMVKNVMTVRPWTAKPDTSVSSIINGYFLKGYYGIPIVDNENRPIGIITETDLLEKAHMPVRVGLLSHFGEKVAEIMPEFEKVKSKDIMSKPVFMIHENEYVSKAVDALLLHHVLRLPVVDDNGTLTGILSIFDIFQTITNRQSVYTPIEKHMELKESPTISDVIITECPAVFPETLIEDVITSIDTSPLRRVAVVDRTGCLVGLIFDNDLLGLFAEHKDTIWDHLLSTMSFSEIGKMHKDRIRQFRINKASEIMCRDIVVTQSDASLEDAVKLIVENRIRYLPVVDKDGQFKGFIGRNELLKADHVPPPRPHL